MLTTEVANSTKTEKLLIVERFEMMSLEALTKLVVECIEKNTGLSIKNPNPS